TALGVPSLAAPSTAAPSAAVAARPTSAASVSASPASAARAPRSTARVASASSGARCTIVGTPHADRLVGTRHRDVICGLGGNDVRGGPGTNWCTLDSADIATRCVYDRTPASPDDFSFSTGAVDVTAASRSVTVRVHVSDDTGVEGVRVVPSPDGDPFTT